MSLDNRPARSRYFPNAVLPCVNTLPSSSLANLPLWRVAQELHGWVRAITPADARRLAAWTAAQENKLAVKHHFPYDRWAFIASAWHTFPLYSGAELDGPAPVLAGPAFTEISLVDGFGIMRQPREGGGRCGVDVKFTVTEAVMRILEEEGRLRGVIRGVGL